MTFRATEQTEQTEQNEHVTRRTLLRGAAVGGAALPLLAACGGGESDAAGEQSSDSSSSSAAGPATVAAADVPVGGGAVIASAKVVVTQPKKGEFKAFSAVCTHQGCLVSKIASGRIDCSCHGSEYSIKDGSVEAGPAPKPLPEKTVPVIGDTLTVS
jgi:nitrite reductase/ring-hydroxylating ferredoxin subunit